MQLSDTAQKVLKGLGIALAIIVVLAVVAFFVCKGSKKNQKVDIHFTMTGPDKFNRSTDAYFTRSILQGITIESFLDQVISTTHLAPWKEIYISWTAISINNQEVQIEKGQIKNPSQLLYNLLGGSIPDKIMFTTHFLHTCTKEEIDRVQATCNPCRGEKAICPSDGGGGAVCVPWQYCPDFDTLAGCCQTNPNGPVPHCDSSKPPGQRKITCSGCTGSINCGSPGCDCIGPMCTATGFICAKGQTCPTGKDLQVCCTGPVDYAVCKNGQLICSPCKDSDSIPSCDESCCGHGLVCGSNGEWQCLPGVRCPSETIEKTCCTTDDSKNCKINDPNKPLPTCNPNAPQGQRKVTCGGCPPPTQKQKDDCPPTCEGQGLVCTVNGWVCRSSGVACPTGATLDNLKCCGKKPGYTPYCTDQNCIACNCPAGTSKCSGDNPNCLTGDEFPQLCCDDHGPQCTLNPLGQPMCCDAERACDNTCCPAGTVCCNAKCLAMCGPQEDVDPKNPCKSTCPAGQECVMISPITQENADKITGSRYDPKTQTAYLCQQSTSVCQFTTDELVASPGAIDNYYPCFSLPSPDPTSDSPGYCAGKVIKPGGAECPDPGNSNTPECFKNLTKEDCEKAEKQDGKCEWRDVMSYVASGTADGPTVRDLAEQIQCDVGFIQSSWNGNFCYPETEAFQRIVAFSEGPGSKCTWQDCVSQVAQPGVIDVEYNPTQGNCIGLLACNTSAGAGYNNNVRQNYSGNTEPNPNITPTSKQGGITAFPQCSSGTKCDLGVDQNIFVCDTNTGRIEYPPVWIGTGSGVTSSCKQVVNPPPSIANEPQEPTGCYGKLCGTDCCLPGWTWDSESMRCYTPKPSDPYCYDSGFKCHGIDCGDVYSGHCDYHIRITGQNCRGPYCYVNATPDNSASNPLTNTRSDTIPYCYCNGSQWAKWTGDSGEGIDQSKGYACTIGKNYESCLV